LRRQLQMATRRFRSDHGCTQAGSATALALADLCNVKDRSSRWQKLCFAVLAGTLIGYAFLAGLHTLNQDDLFWMLATARWVIKHREIPWTDHFSYTAQGQPWIYPVGDSLLFYGVWLIGGYAALSWLGAVSTVGTAAILLRSGSVISTALAVLALPVIATRMEVRADAFTTALFAAFLAILWRYHETGRARLWVLPVLMVVWTNAHLGFPAGLAVIIGYTGVEALELIWPDRRRAAVYRLRRAWPWLLLCFPATLLNPFGWWIYTGVFRQLTAPLTPLQIEWQPIRLAWLTLSLRDANGAFTLTLLAGATAIVVGLAPPARRRGVFDRPRRSRFETLPVRGDVCDRGGDRWRRCASTGTLEESVDYRGGVRRDGGAGVHSLIRSGDRPVSLLRLGHPFWRRSIASLSRARRRVYRTGGDRGADLKCGSGRGRLFRVAAWPEIPGLRRRPRAAV